MKAAFRLALVAVMVLALVPLTAEAQDNDKKKKKKKPKKDVDIVALYDRGAYDEAAAAAEKLREAGTANPEQLFVAGRAYEGLQDTGAAAATYGALVETRPEDDAWHWIGASARALVAGDVNAATEASARAVELDAGNKYAHYERGLVLSHQRAYQPAADSFARLLAIDGNFAYGHYYAGLAYYQVRSLVAATNHFERFLELAPEAPERVQVEGVLAALRGS